MLIIRLFVYLFIHVKIKGISVVADALFYWCFPVKQNSKSVPYPMAIRTHNNTFGNLCFQFPVESGLTAQHLRNRFFFVAFGMMEIKTKKRAGRNSTIVAFLPA